jgi:hypothetical protein
MSNYISSSNLINVLNTNKHKCNMNILKRINSFDIDLFFVRKAYNINSNFEAIQFINKHDYSGIFIHPKQLYNLFNNFIELKYNNVNINITISNNILCDYINIINNYDINKITELTIKKIIINPLFNSHKLLLLVFIGRIDVGDKLIKKLTNYANIEDCVILFCIRDNIYNHYNDLYIMFPNSAIFTCNEFGNDIVPSLLTYNIIKNMNYKFDYIIKLHTKGKNNFNELTDFLLDKKLDNLLKYNNTESSTISLNTCYKNKSKDICNKKLYTKFDYLIKKQYFSQGTIFLINTLIFNKVLDFFINNYKNIVFSNMYDDNSINMHASYVHFLERLFGLIDV